MDFASLSYLVGVYWPHILAGLAIGLVTGWFTVSTRHEG